MIIPVKLSNCAYDIVAEKNSLENVSKLIETGRKVLIVTDDGVPCQYSKTVEKQFKDGYIFCIEQGEKSKGIQTYSAILSKMLELGFTRKDCVVAVGGGVVGDLAGFAASTYMRGVDFYNIPTTLLSQADSSIGGKTAVNLDGVKNAVGTFYQPKKVIIDTNVLATLPERQLSNGLAEIIKMAMTCDKSLFELLETKDIKSNIDEIIIKALNIKRSIVEKDEKEQNLRKVLNFGHTIGHGIESLSDLFHGECVALGMLPMCSASVKKRLLPVLQKVNLPIKTDIDKTRLKEVIAHDKKSNRNGIDTVTVNEVGSFEMKEMTVDEIMQLL